MFDGFGCVVGGVECVDVVVYGFGYVVGYVIGDIVVGYEEVGDGCGGYGFGLVVIGVGWDYGGLVGWVIDFGYYIGGYGDYYDFDCGG